MIARHDVLAMRFSPEGDAQTYTPLSRIHMEYVDLSDRPDPLAAYRRLYSECMQRPFALENCDTCRVFLCRVGSRSARLFVIAHRLVLDGWSERLLWQEIVHFSTSILTVQDIAKERSMA